MIHYTNRVLFLRFYLKFTSNLQFLSRFRYTYTRIVLHICITHIVYYALFVEL